MDAPLLSVGNEPWRPDMLLVTLGAEALFHGRNQCTMCRR
jgi:hypothetical protein